MSLESLVNEIANEIENAEQYNCPFTKCDREFSSKRNLVDHCRGHHQGKKPHCCTYQGCGKSFLRPAHLTIHMRIHTGEKPFVCEHEGCGKRWNQKSALKQHLRSHTGEKPFSCSLKGCSKKFSTSSSCKRHIMTHDRRDSQRYTLVTKHRMMSTMMSMDNSSSSDEENYFRKSPINTPDSPKLPDSPGKAPDSPLKMSFDFLLN